jgi:hypothetical protein
MQPPVNNSGSVTGKPSGARPSPAPEWSETNEDRQQRLVKLLGEVIRMSQAWVGALESGDPFSAEEYEEKCLLIMEKFEAERKKAIAKATSFEQTL